MDVNVNKKPISNHVSIAAVIETLNEALELDPEPMRQIFKNMYRCNLALAQHPSVQVASYGIDEFFVGPLGIINGMFGADKDGCGPIAALLDYFCPQCLEHYIPQNTTDPLPRNCPACEGTPLVPHNIVKFVQIRDMWSSRRKD